MVALNRWVEAFEAGYWHRQTGRWFAIPEEALRNPPPALRGRLAAEGFLGEPDWSSWVVCRSRRVLDLGAELWMPVPSVHSAGGYGYRGVRLSPHALALWRVCNDARTVADVAGRVGTRVEDVLAWVRLMADPELQGVQLRPKPPRPGDPGLRRLVSPPRERAPRGPGHYDAEGGTSLSGYHLDEIVDGTTHFDDRETTVAHALGRPHPALGGERYGQRLRKVMAPTPDARVLEIGGGTGEVMEAWVAAGGPVPTRVDLSPELLETQRRRVPASPGVLADATQLPFDTGSFDLVLCNEVIADLTTTTSSPEVDERRRRYRIPEGRSYNLGAWKLVEEVARVLRPGGRAWISEFGDPHGDPEADPLETEQLDHPEVSIHFGHLNAVARGCGLSARLVLLPEALSMDLTARQLWRGSYQALRALCRSRGVHLEARAWTPDTLAEALPWPVEGLSWVPMTDEGPGPLATRFWVLLLSR